MVFQSYVTPEKAAAFRCCFEAWHVPFATNPCPRGNSDGPFIKVNSIVDCYFTRQLSAICRIPLSWRIIIKSRQRQCSV